MPALLAYLELLTELQSSDGGGPVDDLRGLVIGDLSFQRSRDSTRQLIQLADVDIEIDLQDRLNNRQFVANTDALSVELVTDSNDDPLEATINGPYSIGSLQNCQDGRLTVATNAVLQFDASQNISAGELGFSNAEGNTAVATFATDGSVSIRIDGGTAERFERSELSAFCNL